MQESMRIATRGSELALWQAHHVQSLLLESGACADVEIVVVSTSGDRDKVTPLHQIGGKGIFVKEVQAAVLDGRADVAVHSAKDMPAVSPEGLALGAVPQRGNPCDALVGSTLADLVPGATVATGSVRRRAQLRALRPDLQFAELRGNMATRFARAVEFDAIVVAAAALERLGVQPDIVDVLSVEQMIPQVGQGSLAVECVAGATDVLAALAAVEHDQSRALFECERAFLAELGGDCSLPAGAHAVQAGDEVSLSGFLASEDLTAYDQLVLSCGRDDDLPGLGTELARQLRSRH